MKTVTGIVVLVMLVTGIAVNGSRAGPLLASSVAFQQCLRQDSPPGERCTPAASISAGVDEIGGERTLDQAGYGGLGQVPGGDLSSPEFWSEAHRIVFMENVVVRMALDYLFGRTASPGPKTVHTAALIFDPVK